MIKTALVPIAEGSEELEAVTIIDVLRRAGVEVTVASASEGKNLQISGSSGINIVADKMLNAVRREHLRPNRRARRITGCRASCRAIHPVLDSLLA